MAAHEFCISMSALVKSILHFYSLNVLFPINPTFSVICSLNIHEPHNFLARNFSLNLGHFIFLIYNIFVIGSEF